VNEGRSAEGSVENLVEVPESSANPEEKRFSK